MIRGGTRAEPVAELTIAGNLNDMFARLILANDLVFRRGINAPTIRIDDMMIAGS
ncbi:MAG: metallopeptidase TldD-related protein, partial [Gluconacetobacter sp.]